MTCAAFGRTTARGSTGAGLLALALITGCASAPARHHDLARLAVADARVLDGCYSCLTEARDIYEAEAAGRGGPRVAQRLFEINLLIALRDGELAQDATDAFAKAEALVPATATTADAAFLLDFARAIPTDAVGTPRADTREATRSRREFVATHLATAGTRIAAASVSPELREYLTASLTCLTASSGVRASTPPSLAGAPTDVPLVRYRMSSERRQTLRCVRLQSRCLQFDHGRGSCPRRWCSLWSSRRVRRGCPCRSRRRPLRRRNRCHTATASIWSSRSSSVPIVMCSPTGERA